MMGYKSRGLVGILAIAAVWAPPAAHAGTFEVPVTLHEGSYVCVEGHIGQSLIGIPGTVPAHDFYMKLKVPVYALKKNGALTEATNVVFMRTPKSLAVKTVAQLCGRVDIELTSSVETGKVYNNIFLTGVTRVSQGEPRYDGRAFFNRDNQQLPVATVPHVAEFPVKVDRYVVVDVQGAAFFVAEYDQTVVQGQNPFRGLTRVPFSAPTDTDRQANVSGALALPLHYYGGKAAALLRLDVATRTLYYFDSVGALRAVASVAGII